MTRRLEVHGDPRRTFKNIKSMLLPGDANLHVRAVVP